MSFVKTPTSSLTATELLVNRLWYRGKARIEQWIFGGAESKTPTLRPSPIARLPQELFESIISYFIYDILTLIACSMTCRSWYAAAVPHLHHSLTTDELERLQRDNSLYKWPRPLQNAYHLGLLPLVKRFRIRTSNLPFEKFTSDHLGRRTLRYFSALTNLQELGIDNLHIYSFMPNIQRCFGHFAPTLRFLALKDPRGSCRQILYFIGLFPNLQDLKICYPIPTKERECSADAELVPLSIPPLRGRLIIMCFTRVKVVEDMIALFGGLRFRHLDLFRVECTRLLLGACAETLETLRLYPMDPYANDQEVRWHFDLSRNKALKTLETTATSISRAGDAASSFLKTILSTITSSQPLDVVITYHSLDLDRSIWSTRPGLFHVDYSFAEGRAINAQLHTERFKVFGEMYRVRDFRLVLCADVLDCIAECAMRTLEDVVEVERMAGRVDYLPREPLIISEIRSPHTRLTDDPPGWGPCFIPASAL